MKTERKAAKMAARTQRELDRERAAPPAKRPRDAGKAAGPVWVQLLPDEPERELPCVTVEVTPVPLQHG